jgi:ribosomal protein RSM22 (predicted rRNA methylase)
VRRFATVGTGSGTDTIAALNIFPALQTNAMTDLHVNIVTRAKHNSIAATDKADSRIKAVAKEAVGLVGDVLVPLRG